MQVPKVVNELPVVIILQPELTSFRIRNKFNVNIFVISNRDYSFQINSELNRPLFHVDNDFICPVSYNYTNNKKTFIFCYQNSHKLSLVTLPI